MRQQATNLSDEERRAVAQWLTNTELKENDFPKDAYTPFSLNSAGAFDHSGWGGDKEGTGLRTTEQAGISRGNIQSLQLKWAFAFPDATYCKKQTGSSGRLAYCRKPVWRRICHSSANR
jgi:polyvinyl alcohol dehydrogenase (cytochrome)